jgi:hypothetical protein
MVSPLETLPPRRSEWGSSLHPECFVSRGSISHLAFVCFRKRLSRKSNNVVVFPFDFHIAVRQPFSPLWSHLLLHDHEPSRASFALCFMSLLMSLLRASGEILFGFPSPRHLSTSGSYPLDLSGLGDPTGSNATAGLSLRVTGTHKPLYQGKVEIPTKGVLYILSSIKILCMVYELLLWDVV